MTQPRTWALSKTETDCGRERPKNPTASAVWSVNTVASFESVGAILVAAMLIVPAATAYLLTDRLGIMLGLSVVTGALSAAGGY
jgi:ABC-type Mn2+/Zn2+ transport system permease subunit